MSRSGRWCGKCLDAKAADPAADVAAWERQIDARVAALYGLDPADLPPTP